MLWFVCCRFFLGNMKESGVGGLTVCDTHFHQFQNNYSALRLVLEQKYETDCFALNITPNIH